MLQCANHSVFHSSVMQKENNCAVDVGQQNGIGEIKQWFSYCITHISVCKLRISSSYFLYLIVPFWYASAAYQASLVEPLVRIYISNLIYKQ